MRLRWKFFIFCIIGGISAIVDLTIFNILFFFKINFTISRTLAVFSAVLFNFYLNRNITFSARGHSIKKQLPKHLIVYGLVMLTNVSVSTLVVLLLGKETLFANIASIIGIISGIPISFIGSYLWTFKKHNST